MKIGKQKKIRFVTMTYLAEANLDMKPGFKQGLFDRHTLYIYIGLIVFEYSDIK